MTTMCLTWLYGLAKWTYMLKHYTPVLPVSNFTEIELYRMYSIQIFVSIVYSWKVFLLLENVFILQVV